MKKEKTVYFKQKKVALILVVFVLFCSAVVQHRLYFNLFSSSMPRGLYQRVDEEPKIGSITATCLTEELARYGLERGYLLKGGCPTGIQPVLKKIFAGDKDTVAIHNGRVTINGQKIDGIDILETDSHGRDVAIFYESDQLLNKGEFWLMSDHKKKSWDSRYWGPVKAEYTYKPVWTINE